MFKSLWDYYCMPHFDNMLWYAKTCEDHIVVLSCIVRALQHHCVDLRLTKCQVHYVGRLVSADGVWIDPKDLEAIQALRCKIRSTVREACKLQGFLSYQRTYIQHFCRIVHPMYEQAKNIVSHPRQKQGKGVQLSSSTPIHWTGEHHRALYQLIHILSNLSVLGYPDFHLPFVLQTDTSEQWLGVELCQHQSNHYGCGTLKPTEQNDNLHSGEKF